MSANENIVDPTNDAGDLDELEKQLGEAVTAGNAKAKADAADTPEEKEAAQADIPEKYKGKTLQDIIEMHRNLESQYGRMANDLGQQRKLTDKLLDLKRTDDLNQGPKKPAKKPIQVSSTDLLDNPSETLEKILEEREAAIRQEYEQRMSEFESGLAQERFVQKHPDYQEVAQSETFLEWVNSSPIRQQAANQAANGDFAIADALLNEYKSTRPAQKQEPSNDENLDAARKASLESSSTAGKQSGGKVYRRADLIRLKLEKPQTYADPDFQREIMQAYAEGRVK